jgi:hypothetical protein
VRLTFSGEIWLWKGPAPWHFVTVPGEQSADLEALSPSVTYGWGMIPVGVEVGASRWSTSLWPHEGAYVLPLKAAIRRAEHLELGDVVEVTLDVDLDR